MALSNAERQRRYRERLKAQANGVTADMVVRAIQRMWEHDRQHDPSIPAWPEYLASLKGVSGAVTWRLNLSGLSEDQASDYPSEDETTLRNVIAVINAVLNPPKP